MDIGQQITYDGLLRAARLAAGIAGARGPRVDEVADEAIARLLMLDVVVNNPKAWVRSVATRLAAETHAHRRIRTVEVLAGLTATERTLVTGHRAGWTVSELAAMVDLSEGATRELLVRANRTLRRSRRTLAADTAVAVDH